MHAQFDRLIDYVAGKLPAVAEHLAAAREDILAFTAFPKDVWTHFDWLSEPIARSGECFGKITLRIGPREPVMTRCPGYTFTEPLVLCKSAINAIKEAADASLRRTFEDSMRSPWTRVIRYGGQDAGLRSVVAAELQASWVGAIWHLPGIRQQYARIALPEQADPFEVSRALGYWIRGGGKDLRRVIEAYEARLTPEALDVLLNDHLHEGRAIKRPADWTTVCHALWDQLPVPLCLSLIQLYEPRSIESPHDDGAEQIALFASLVMRAPDAWASKVSAMSDEHLATVVRFLHPTLVKFVPQESLERCIRALLGTQDAFGPDWTERGWTTAGVMWKRLAAPSGPLTGQLRDAIPISQSPMVALNAPGLVKRAPLILAREAAIATLETDLSNAKKGMFAHWGQEPASQLARTLLAMGRATNRSVNILISTANARECSSGQRNAALRALTSLVEEGVARPSLRDIPWSVRHVPSESGGFVSPVFQDSASDLRLERIARAGLRVRLSATQVRTGDILEATRDADPRVRQTALGITTWLMSKRRKRTAALETAVFGGLYDPEPAVQADSAEVISQLGLHDDSLDQVAMKRIEETFSLMHREVRAAIARALADRGREDGVYGRIRDLARMSVAMRKSPLVARWRSPVVAT